MKKYAFNELTVLQYIFFIHGTQVGIGVLSMPRELAVEAGTDGWISILIGWVFATVASLLIVNIMKRYPGKTIVDLIPVFFGKWLGMVVSALVACYCALAAMTVVASGIGIVNVWILSQTPGYVLAILTVIPTYMVVQGGLRVLGRYAELIFYLTLWMPIVIFSILPYSNWLHLLPVLKEGWMPVFSATKSTILSFLGFELAFFLYPFLQRKQYASLGIVAANTLSMLIFMHITVFSFSFFSPDEITQYTWPTLNLWKVIEYRFLERIDIIFLAFYLFFLSTTTLPYIYFTVFTTSQMVGSADHRKHLFILMILIVVGAWLYTPTFIDLKKWSEVWSMTGMVGGYIIPVIWWLAIQLFRRGKGGQKG